VLALSDAAHKSDGALQFAGSLASRFNMPVHVVHAMELTQRSLRSIFPVLNNIDEEMKAANAVLEEQVGRLIPASVEVTSMVSMFDPWRAIERRAAEISPFITIAPPGIVWSMGAVTASRCARINSPLCIVRTPERDRRGGVALISHADVFRDAVVSSAKRWCRYITDGIGDVNRAPTEVFLLPDDADLGNDLAHITQLDVDVIAVHMQALEVPQVAWRVNAVISALLSQTRAMILLLPKNSMHTDLHRAA
jgi:hypothetical protein